MTEHAVVTKAFATYVALGGKQRTSLWCSELPEAAQEEGFYAENSAALCQLLFQTLFEYIDLPSQRAVLNFIRQAVSNDFFLKTFAGAICRMDPGSYGRKESFVVLCWSSVVLRKLQPSGAQKAIDKLVQCQGACLDALWRNYCTRSQKSWIPIQRVINKNVYGCPWLAEQYLTACSTSGSEGLARALLRAPPAAPGLSGLQDQLIKGYCNKILASKEATSAHVQPAYEPLLAQVSSQQFVISLLRVLLRMLKRSPEVTLPSLASICSSSRLGLSDHATDLMAVLLPNLRSSKDNLRQLGISALQELAGRLEQPSAVETVCAKLLGILSGKAEGKLKGAYERVGLAGGLQALASGGPATIDLSQLADSTADSLCSLYKGQPNEETRLAVLAAAAAWLEKASKVPSAATALLSSGLQEPSRKHHLQALIQILRGNPGTQSQSSSLAGSLSKVVKDGLTKAAQRAEGAAALLAAVLIAHADPKSDAALSSAHIWEKAGTADSPLLSPGQLSKAAIPDALNLVHLAEALLSQPSEQHKQALEGQQSKELALQLCRLLMTAALHHSKAVQAAACLAASQCIKARPSLAEPFAAAALARLEDWSELEGLVDPAAAADDDQLSENVLSTRFTAALHGITPQNAQGISPRALALLLMGSHHPIITRVWRSPRKAWTVAARRLEGVEDFMTGQAHEVVGILQQEGLESQQQQSHAAACLALGSSLALDPDALF